jgi:hypothetical protein
VDSGAWDDFTALCKQEEKGALRRGDAMPLLLFSVAIVFRKVSAWLMGWIEQTNVLE